MDGGLEGKMFFFGSNQPTSKEPKPSRQRKRSPDKMQRNRDLTAARRQEENTMISEFTNVLPLSKEELKKADRTALIRLALHFIKMKAIPGLSQSETDVKRMTSALTSSIDVPGFSGFVLLMDSELNIMYASENITKQLGPLLVDTIGQQLDDLVHPDDYDTARDSLMSVFTEGQGSNKKVNFVAGMKTTLSTSIRSASKIQYKNVFVTCYLKTFGAKGDLPWTNGNSKSMAVLLCRSEDIKGLPEICYGSYVESFADLQCRFVKIDIRSEWIFGYGSKSLIGKEAKVIRHPADELDASILIKRKELIFCRGSFVCPPYRVVTTWGDWLWVRSSFEPQIGQKGEWKGFKVRTWIVGTGEVVTAALQSAVMSNSISAPQGSPPKQITFSQQPCRQTPNKPHLQTTLQQNQQTIPQSNQQAKFPPSRHGLCSSCTSSGYSSPDQVSRPTLSPLFKGSNTLSVPSTSYSSPTSSGSPTSLSGQRGSQSHCDDVIEDFLRDIMWESDQSLERQSDYSNHTSPHSITNQPHLSVFSPESRSSFSDHSNHADSHIYQQQLNAFSPGSTASTNSSVSIGSQPPSSYHSPVNPSTECSPSPETPLHVDFFSTQRGAAFAQSHSPPRTNGHFNSTLPPVSNSQLFSSIISTQGGVTNTPFKHFRSDFSKPCSIQGTDRSTYRDFTPWTDSQHPILL